MRNQSSTILSGNTSASITGAVVLDVNQVINVTFQPIVTGGATTSGTVKVQGSNQLPANSQRAGFAPTAWADIPGAASTLTAGVGSMIVLSNVACQFMRVVFTQTGGAAGETLTVQANSVGI